MTGAGDGAGPATADPFVQQVTWLVNAAGGRKELARATANAVSARTLDYWCRGRYPRNAVTGAVRDLDAWALANAPGYPEAAGAPRLVDSCGLGRAVPGAPPSSVVPVEDPAPAPAPAPAPTPAPSERPAEPPRDQPTGRSGRRAWVLGAAAAVLVAASVLATVLVLESDDEAPADPGPLPSAGNGTPVPETTGSLGANTFADPRLLVDNAQPIPPDTTVPVRCRYYAPSIPSVVPDGFWYLIDSGEWAGRWTPANSFMNGDVPGEPTLHNTDFAVPVCE